MPVETGYDPGNRFVRQAYIGAIALPDYVAGTAKAMELFAEHGIADCLLDLRRIDNRASLAQLYDLPQLYIEMAGPRNARISIVAEPGQKDADSIRFYETICLNRGWKVHTSYDEAAAVAWLTGKAAA